MLEDLLHQKCVYWPPGNADKYGNRAQGTAVERDCHWEDKAVEQVDGQGRVFITQAVIQLDTVVLRGGWLWLGLLADAPATAPSTNVIRNVDTITHFDDEVLYVANI